MAELGKFNKVIETDVLVIGGGFAGCWAALRARDFTDKVILVEKAKVARSGCSTFASGVQLCPTEMDDLDVWKAEIVRAGDYFPDQDWIDVFLRNQIERIKDYEKWSSPLERNEHGKIARIVGRGHIDTRLFQFHGPKLMGVLREQLISKGAKMVERIMVVDLLTSDGKHPTRGKVTGAIGLDTRTGQPYIFEARATVIASGPMGGKRCNVDDTCTGDGGVAALRAGAEITNMEFCTHGNIDTWLRKTAGAGINMIQGHGAHIINALGERFMPKYDPVLAERSSTYRLSLAFARESLLGRGPIYVDMRHFSAETFNKLQRVVPRAARTWDSLGFDPSKELLECTPSWGLRSSSGEGGIKVDLGCRTNIPGLFAAGSTTRNPVQGIYALGGIATASANVMGYVAGEEAAKEALEAPKPETDWTQVTDLWNSSIAPLHRKPGPTPADLFSELDRAVFPAKYSMFKNARRITQVLGCLERIKGKLPAYAGDCHELIRANEFGNYLTMAELIFRAALERQESRQFHYREEFPYRDDANWLKLVVLKKVGRQITIGTSLYRCINGR